MKNYMMIIALSTIALCINAIDEQSVLDALKGVAVESRDDVLHDCFHEADAGSIKKICYNLLFNENFLFLKDQENLVSESAITFQLLRSSLIRVLKEYAISVDKEFLEIYEKNYLGIALVPEHFLSLYAGHKIQNRLVTQSTQYTIDPFYIAFREIENRQDALRFMNYLHQMGIEYRKYSTRPRFCSDDYFMTPTFPKNILEILGISEVTISEETISNVEVS